MANMSFWVTTAQIENETKTVTRRLSWWKIKPGQILQAVKKCQGLKRGERVERLKTIRVTDANPEPLSFVTPSDVIREGFYMMDREEFIAMFMKMHKLKDRDSLIMRIEFEYVIPGTHAREREDRCQPSL